MHFIKHTYLLKELYVFNKKVPASQVNPRCANAHNCISAHQINIYELIWVCLCPHNIQMISETAYSSQIKLIGKSLCISEHGIGYSNLAFEAEKGWYSVLSPWNA